ncbi:benzoate 4-monooxygenase cytochrome P450 [Stipitochalara longipes BDJ]|nr:benzoate 4-monooxygenase cytochrome P450 [Stipitochalara longipes BDJ]
MGLLTHLTQLSASFGWLSLVLLLFIAVTVTLISHAVYNLYFHPLSKFPGPWYAGISEFFFSYTIVSGSVHLTLKALHDKYGEVVRVAPGELSFSSATSWKDIYGQRKSGKVFTKDPRFLRTDETLRAPHLVSTTSVEEHNEAKKLLAHAFSPKHLLDQEDTILRYVNMLMASMAEESHKGPLDLKQWYNWVTFDVLGELCFGEPFGSVAALETSEWVATILNMVILTSWSCAIYHISPFLEKFLWILSPPSVRKAALNHIDKSQAKIQARMDRGEGERKDFCSYLFELRDQMGLNMWHMTSYSNTLIIAGSETTATSMSTLTYWLCRTPRVYEKLKQEVRGRFKTSSEINSMRATFPYLTAVISEIMRLVPPMPFGTPRVVPEGGETVDGVWIPGGTFVSCHAYCSSRSAKYFKDPESFVPERWLDPECTDNLSASNPFLLGWGACLGQNMAMMEMRILIAKSVFLFDFELADEKDRAWENMKNYILWEKPALWVKVTPREDVC